MFYRDRRLTGAIHGEWAPTLDGARALLLARCEAQATALRRGAAEYEAQAARTAAGVDSACVTAGEGSEGR